MGSRAIRLSARGAAAAESTKVKTIEVKKRRAFMTEDDQAKTELLI